MKILLMYSPTPAHREALIRASQGRADLSVASSEEEAKRLARDTEVILGNRYFLQSLPFARKLKWMQSNSVGMDLILQARDQLRGIYLTCSKGVYDDEMADHALALILALFRRIHLFRDQQREAVWKRETLPHLAQRKALILGFGGVGRGIARRLSSFGVKVWALRRSHSGDPELKSSGIIIVGPDRWRSLLPDIDILVLALPLTRLTFHLVSTEELKKLPARSLVINIGRGETIDQSALLEQLNSGKIAGAGLDVLEYEPPESSDPVWTESRLLLTPHVARSKESPPFRWEPLFVENLRRYTEGLPLLNLVDIDKGY